MQFRYYLLLGKDVALLSQTWISFSLYRIKRMKVYYWWIVHSKIIFVFSKMNLVLHSELKLTTIHHICYVHIASCQMNIISIWFAKNKVHGPYRSPEKTVQINKHIWLYYNVDLIRDEKPIIIFMKIKWFFIWTNLNPLHLRMLCAMFDWNWHSGYGEEDF